MLIKYVFILVLILGSFSDSRADDEYALKNQWLVDFTSSELMSANSLIVTDDPDSWNKKEFVSIAFEFENSEYTYVYELNYRENWDLLTKDGLEAPPEIKKKFASSHVNTWSNFKGTGTYTESYERTVPNWQNFDQLSLLLESLAKFEFDSPLNGLFMADEAKILKKLYKSNDLNTAALWRQLSYDKKGNVIGLSTKYLESKKNTLAEQSISITNKSGLILYFTPVTLRKSVIVSGVVISSEKNEMLVFNSSLNRMLFKFASTIFPDPEAVFTTYLGSLEKGAGKRFERLADNYLLNE